MKVCQPFEYEPIQVHRIMVKCRNIYFINTANVSNILRMREDGLYLLYIFV